MPGQQGISIAYQAAIGASFDRLTELALSRVEAAGTVENSGSGTVACTWMTADVGDARGLLSSSIPEIIGEKVIPISEREFQLGRQAAGR